MCGIVGIVSNKSVSESIISALKKLEYRGYDSAGISTISKGQINEKKCSGRVDNLEKILFKNPSKGSLGIGHVRWATHGTPSQINAHPHSSEEVSVVNAVPSTLKYISFSCCQSSVFPELPKLK